MQHYALNWLSPVSSTNKTDHHDITKILLKVELNTITLTKPNTGEVSAIVNYFVANKSIDSTTAIITELSSTVNNHAAT
jgi:hypothetical protein